MYRWTIPTWTEIQPFEWQMFIASGMVEFHRFLLWAFINISVLWAEEKSGNISTKGTMKLYISTSEKIRRHLHFNIQTWIVLYVVIYVRWNFSCLNLALDGVKFQCEDKRFLSYVLHQDVEKHSNNKLPKFSDCYLLPIQNWLFQNGNPSHSWIIVSLTIIRQMYEISSNKQYDIVSKNISNFVFSVFLGFNETCS